MAKKILLILVATFIMFVSGCVTIPCEELTPDVQTQELTDHVNFLAQPALKGRKPKTWESQKAQEYIKSRFDIYGLVPWAQTDTYAQPFLLGTNIIGVLPGTDPDLRDQIVMLTAHYDHLGVGKQGVYHGAADNASGVAMLLEAAEHFSLAKNRPKRSICFASFDCEELFTIGAFFFTCRDDFKDNNIVAVVNVDVLGRDFADIVENSLLVVGTERYPQLQSNIMQNAETEDLKVLPLSSDLVGPRGDHVAFESLDVPVLFFTSGLYKDYHKTTDTPEKINFDKMTRSSNLILKTLTHLVNTDSIESPVKQNAIKTDTLISLKHLINTIIAKFKIAGLTTKEVQQFEELAKETQQLIDSEIDISLQYEAFIYKALKMLMPIMAIADESIAENGDDFLRMGELYSAHSTILIEWYREMVNKMDAGDFGLFEPLDFKYQAYNTRESDISFMKNEIGQYDLDLIIPQVNLELQAIWPFIQSDDIALYESIQIIHFFGSRDDIIDHCLVKWNQIQDDPSYDRSLAMVLKTVTDKAIGTDYNDWMQWRVKSLGCADQQDWLQYLKHSDNEDLARKADAIGDVDKLCKIITDPSQPTRKRSRAIEALNEKSDPDGLLVLISVLNDKTQIYNEETVIKPQRFMSDSYPLAENRHIRHVRQWWQKRQGTWLDDTIGDKAQEKLESLTEQKFEKNKNQWLRWVKQNKF